VSWFSFTNPQHIPEFFLVLCAVARVLAYFAGAGVCSTPAALICAANYCRTSAKKPESIDEKVNTRIDTA
jgi:hypothetical protein